MLGVRSRCGPRSSLTLFRAFFWECFSPFVTSWTAPSASGRSGRAPVGVFHPAGQREPSQGTQNGHNESFNGVFRDGCLNRWLFESVREVREVTDEWLREYNEERPHGALKGMPPAAFCSEWIRDQKDVA